MKFKNYLETIAGVSIYPLISLVIFVAFFVGLLWYVLRMGRQEVDAMKAVPLDDSVIKKTLLTILALLVVPSAFAQGTEVPTSYSDFLLYVVMFLLVCMILVLLVVLVQVIVLYQKITTKALPAEVQAESTPLFSPGWWRKFVGFSTPLSKEEKILLAGHEYDGIHELDNRMPPWLQFMFVGTVLFAITYGLYYHAFGFGDLQMEELNKELAMAEVQKKAYIEKMGAGINEENVTLLTEGALIKEGGVIFTEKCTACHAADGGGGVGPNLTDDYWLHGGDIKDVFKVIKYGVPEKGMISWEKQLPPQEMQKVASFILAELHGNKPMAPKAPQGELYETPADVPTNPVPQALEVAKQQ
ncbi:cbb3-type cytochrome c oxidase N-terminal domain-containing protein [Salmonirosea aquatica]|uniref:C-type cytochrome n=1 Tax=Salmonirosea aquatica TaxID=2654236 RepID=A0A7C9BE24_9BACT|nr:c-type cytochrome [Cytophagaceae bacterium SJW1-29]